MVIAQKFCDYDLSHHNHFSCDSEAKGPCYTIIYEFTLPMDQQFNLDFEFKSEFNLEFQPELGIQLGIPIPMVIKGKVI